MTSGGTTGMDKQPLAECRNTQYAAAFLATLVARHLDLRRSQDPRIGDLFLCLSGYGRERQQDFEGKRTVQTVNGFDKPVLNGYRLLAKLGPEWLASRVAPADKNLWVAAARDAQRQMAVVVTHFRNDVPDSRGPAQPVQLEIATPWADGTPVELRHWRIDAAHSNAYTVYCRLGKPNPPTAEQSQQIKHRMGLEPLEAPRPIVIHGKVELALDLPCNGVSLVELVRKN